MKPKTEILVFSTRVSVLDGGTRQVANVLQEQCVSGLLPTIARALARGLATAKNPILLRTFGAAGNEVRRETVRGPQPKAAAK